VFSDSIEISDCLPLSSDVEQGPGFITVPDINNNTAMIIKIKTAVMIKLATHKQEEEILYT
jgi:hypothetical protein